MSAMITCTCNVWARRDNTLIVTASCTRNVQPSNFSGSLPYINQRLYNLMHYISCPIYIPSIISSMHGIVRLVRPMDVDEGSGSVERYDMKRFVLHKVGRRKND